MTTTIRKNPQQHSTSDILSKSKCLKNKKFIKRCKNLPMDIVRNYILPYLQEPTPSAKLLQKCLYCFNNNFTTNIYAKNNKHTIYYISKTKFDYDINPFPCWHFNSLFMMGNIMNSISHNNLM
jgi:hypothetical protein